MCSSINFDIFQSLKIVFILANSADPNEMPHHAAFHLGLQCLPKYRFMGTNTIQNEKDIYVAHCMNQTISFAY